MPTVNVEGVGIVNFPDNMPQAAIVAAIENDILPNKVKYGIAARAANPPAFAQGDPNAKPESLLEQAAPMVAHPIDAVSGAASAINPMPMLRDPQMYQHIGNEIVGGQGSAREAARQRLAARGSKLWTGDPRDPQAGQDLRDMFTWAVPLFGQAMAGAGQQMESPNAETRARGGGAAIALTSGPSVINRAAGAVGGALERSGTPPPLTESLGSQLVAKGKVLSPAEDLRVSKVKPDAQQAQLANLAEKYPQADIHDAGSDFVVRAARPSAEPATAPPTILDRLGDLAKNVGKNTVGAVVGGIAGKLVDHPVLGAELGAAAQATVRNLIQSPLWKATSGAVKTAVGKAMQAQDFNTVTTIGARILGGQDLKDNFGHDAALHSWVQDAIRQTGGMPPSPPQLNQILQDYTAAYVSPDGTATQVPLHVLRQTINALTTNPSAIGISTAPQSPQAAPNVAGRSVIDVTSHPSADLQFMAPKDLAGQIRNYSPPAGNQNLTPTQNDAVTYDKNYQRGDNNNPTNLKFGALTKQWVDSGKAELDPMPALDGGHFLKFATLSDGLEAAKQLLLTSAYRDLPVDKAMGRWSNSAYDAAELGLPTFSDKKISELSDGELHTLIERMAHYESGYRVQRGAQRTPVMAGGGGG